MKIDKSILFLALSCLCFYVVLSEIYGTKFITNFINSIAAGMDFSLPTFKIANPFLNPENQSSTHESEAGKEHGGAGVAF